MTMRSVKVLRKAADQGQDEVTRLTNMVVREVSTVDRAANKRTFLVVKADGLGPELESDGKGGFRVKEVAKQETSPEEAPPVDAAPEETPPVDAAPDGDKTEATTKAAGTSGEDQEPAPVVKLEVPDALVAAALAVDVPVEKAGRKLARQREAKLRQAVELLMQVLADTTAKVSKREADMVTLRKELESAKTRLATLSAEHDALKNQHTTYVRAVHAARATVPTSKVLREQAQTSGRVVWPADLARETETR